MEPKILMLIDGNNIAYRAFYALPETIATTAGTTTNAVLGFTSMLFKLIEDYQPESIIAAFDTSGPTFRHEAYRQYKINRKKMPEGLGAQFPLIKEVLAVLKIPVLEKEGYEADDIIATVARQAGSGYDQVLIVSGDKDILQLVSGKVQVVVNKKGITDTLIYDSKQVKEKFGVSPSRIKDLLALMGDSSDNIPGVMGIGPKTARKLLAQFSGVKEIYQNLAQVKNEKLRSNLEQQKDMAEMSLALTRLKDIEDLGWEEYLHKSFTNIQRPEVERLFNNLEFKNLLKKLGDLNLGDKKLSGPVNRRWEKKDLAEVTSPQDLLALSEKIDDRLYLLKLETSPPSLLLCSGNGPAYHVELNRLNKDELKDSLAQLLASPVLKCGYDFKGIYKLLMALGCPLKGKVADVKIMYLLLNQHLPDISWKDLAYNMCSLDLEQEQKCGQMQLELGTGPERNLDLGLASIGLLEQIYGQLEQKLKQEGLDRVYAQIEEPLIEVLANMEYRGVYVDQAYLNKLIVEYDQNIRELEQEIFELCGEKFNLNSTQQLASILYEKLKLTPTKRTKTGYSTDASALSAIYGQSPVIAKILDYRELTKLKNTYIDVLPKLVEPRDGRIHTTYNQMGTTTGRISSNDPNLQNIPIRTSLGKKIRKAFIPGPGYDLILAADYSQIELRVLAHLSGDEGLIDAFNQGQDIHSRTASEIFGVDYQKVDETLRRKAKAINFGIIYGMTKYGLMGRLDISEQEAEDYIQAYFARYPQVKTYLDQLITTAYSCGYATTIFGRKRKIVELGSSNGRLRSLGERLAVNTPIQGSAADIMKLAMIQVYRQLKHQQVDSNLILNVHDEVVLELKEEDSEKVSRLVRESMEDCVSLKVRLRVDVNIGPNWYI
ncbi:MAG: DNA polymerase I [Actinomycetota bacterium]|nr:DNA polymerase I [Actinomycetota bacterium]